MTAKFVLVKLSPLVMTEFLDRKSLLLFLIIDIQTPLLSAFQYGLSCSRLVLWFSSDYQTSDSDCGEM